MKVLVGLVGEVIVPPVPLIMLHAPVPITGVLPASVVEVIPHIEEPVWSGPALDIVGACWNVILTSLVDAAQGALLIIHRNLYDVPGIPVKVLVGLVGVVIMPPVPLIMLHAPVPTTGVFAARFVDVSPHIVDPVWSGPALDTVGDCWNVILTSLVDAAQGALLIVHLNLYDVPGIPVKVLVGLVGVVIVSPVPLIMLHNPVPIIGVFAARVVVVNPHIEEPVWSKPALAMYVGITLTVTASLFSDSHSLIVWLA